MPSIAANDKLRPALIKKVPGVLQHAFKILHLPLVSPRNDFELEMSNRLKGSVIDFMYTLIGVFLDAAPEL